MTYAEMLPPNNSLVRLTEAPRGSWAQAGETVRVTYKPHVRNGKKGIHAQTSIYIWDQTRGCGTIDQALFWRWAKWEIIAE